MRILFLSRWYPYPPDNGSKIRIFGLLRGLCARHDVTLISFFNSAETPAAPPSGEAPSEIRLCSYKEFQPGSGRALLGYLTNTPRFLVDTHSPAMEGLIKEALSRKRYDLVIASQLPMAAYHRAFEGVPAIFEEVELGIYRPDDMPRASSSFSRARRMLTWGKHQRYMARLLQNFVFCTVASEVERGLLAAAVPGYRAVQVVPNSVEAPPVEENASSRVPDSLIFTGSLRYTPNHDAMVWFLSEVFPSVRAEIPTVRLTITGEAGPQRPAADPNVVMTGRVADVRPLVAASAVSLAPIRMGGGTRLKVLEAMAVGTPVVATSKAAEGLDARDGEHLMIADSPRAFSEAVRGLLRDPVGARQMAQRAWRFCHDRYDASIVVTDFLRLIDRAVAA